jgi:hypothetical protein
MGARVSIGIGSPVRRDGELCEVIALEADEVVVTDRLGRAARVRLADLFGEGGPSRVRLPGGGVPGAAEDPCGVVLGAAGDHAADQAADRAAHAREVLSGFRSGSAELPVFR